MQEYGLLMDKYYFYNPETGCDWEEYFTTVDKMEQFLEKRSWIKEGEEAKEMMIQAEQKRQEWAKRAQEDQEK